ncbi:MAG: HAD family phosphatase, partial [Planctomycetota bacterium]
FAASFGQTSRDIIRAWWPTDLTDEQIRALDDEKERIYRQLIAGMVPLTIGARETLAALRDAGVTLAVATSAPPENLDLVLGETRLGPFFAATVHGRDVAHGKPAPDVYLLAAERCGLEPRCCVVVEDAPVGIRAGCAAGMRTIGLVGTHDDAALRAAGADEVVQQLRQVTPELVARLCR